MTRNNPHPFPKKIRPAKAPSIHAKRAKSLLRNFYLAFPSVTDILCAVSHVSFMIMHIAATPPRFFHY